MSSFKKSQYLKNISQIKLHRNTNVNSFAIGMKSIAIIFLLGLFTCSFLENSKLLSISKKASTEICDDQEAQEDVEDINKLKKSKAPLDIYISNTMGNTAYVSNQIIMFNTKLIDVSYAVDIQPPRV